MAASASRRCSRMSARTRSVAVAVRAIIGVFGKRSRRFTSCRYSGRKSWPHSLMQCASSMAKAATSICSRKERKEGVIRRSGAA